MKEKFKLFGSKIKNNISKLAVACAGVVAMIGSAFAAEGDPPSAPTVSQIQTFMSKITDTFSVTVILELLGAIVAFGVVYALLWWAVRKVVRAGMSAVKKGKIRV